MASLTKYYGSQANPFKQGNVQAAIKRALDAAARRAVEEFKRTTATWETKVEFKTTSPDPYTRIVGTENQIYDFVTHGTRPHIIQAAPGGTLAFATTYTAKTAVNVLGSTGGGPSGGVAFAQQVQHPGTKARNFEKLVADAAQRNIVMLFNQELQGAFR